MEDKSVPPELSISYKVCCDVSLTNIVSLNYTPYYDDPKYNHLRRCKIILFSECLGEFSTKDDMEYEIIQSKQSYITKYFKYMNFSNKTINIILQYTFPILYTKKYICVEIEKSCLTRAIENSKNQNIRCIWSNDKFVNIYHDICYKIAINLDSTSVVKSNYIKDKIVNKDCVLQDIANLTDKELCPDIYIIIDKKIETRNNLKTTIKFSELYKCFKCKRNQCTTERVYNRSIDEGINLMINCTFCGNRWPG